MEMRKLMQVQAVLIINWIIIPLMGVFLWIKLGFILALTFFILRWVVDAVWDKFTEIVMRLVPRGSMANDNPVPEATLLSYKVPKPLALVMIGDLLGTLAIPWVLAVTILNLSQTIVTTKATGTGGPPSRVQTENQTAPIPLTSWSRQEYDNLTDKVKNAPKSEISSAYKTGPGGESVVTYDLSFDRNLGLILTLSLPKEAIFTLNEATNEKKISSDKQVITLRDHDLDGTLDDWFMEPLGKLVYDETLTGDGFVKYRDHPDHQFLKLSWQVGIGVAINQIVYEKRLQQ